MKCPKCGTELPKGASQCSNCGQKFVTGKYCPRCRAVIPSNAAVCPQCKKNISAAPEKKPITKRWWFWTAAAVLVIGIIGNIGNAINPDKASPTSSAASSEAPVTNPFLLPDVEVNDVMNGLRTEKIGEWACIHMKKADAKAASEEEFAQFAAKNVSGNGYNWWSVIFEDGTGICFTGSYTYVSTYGKLDEEGCIVEALGDISLNSDTSHTSYTQRAEKTTPTPTATPVPAPKGASSPTEEPAQEIVITPAPEKSSPPSSSSSNTLPGTDTTGNGGTGAALPGGQQGNGTNFDTYDNPDQQQTSANYVLNTSTMKFHYPSCNSVKKIAPQNYGEFTGTREEAIAAGYSSCGKCNP